MSARIIDAGLSSSVQDMGRKGHRRRGVPLGGAADPLSLALANYCVGNDPNCAGLEMTLIGPSLEFDSPSRFAICGANVRATLNGKPVSMNKGYQLSAGDTLIIGTISQGVRAYLALGGGVDVAVILGGRSAYSFGKFGGHNNGQNLQAGERLNLITSGGALHNLPQGAAPQYARTLVLRIMTGPEFSWLAEPSQKALTAQPFTASQHTDRMGARLTGPPLALSNMQQMSSSAILPGTLQCPPNGALILMLADGHCSGGYPRIAQIVRADRYLLGQIGPSTKLHFVCVSSDEASTILRRRSAFYKSFMPEFSF